MFGKGIYLSVFYCLCYEMGISTDMSEDQVSEDRYPDLNKQEDIRMDEIRYDNWRGIAEEGDDKNKTHLLRWQFYVRERQLLIKIELLVSFQNPKWGKIVWTCVKDNMIN